MSGPIVRWRVLLGLSIAFSVTPFRDSAHARWSTEFDRVHDFGSEIRCGTSWRGELVVGGCFGSINGSRCANVARWDGRRWRPFGAGLEDCVMCFLEHEGRLVAGGTFEYGDRIPRYLVVWDGARWLSQGDGPGLPAWSLASFEGKLTAALGQELMQGVGRVARWDEHRWQVMGGDFDGPAWALAVFGDDLFVGGAFDGFAARWTGKDWESIPGLPAPVARLLVFRGGLAAKLHIPSEGRDSSAIESGIYVLEGDRWRPLDMGPRDGLSTEAVGVFEDDLVVVERQEGCRRWDGRNWVIVASPVEGRLHALLERSGRLYGAGAFWDRGGSTIESIRVLHGGSWEDLAAGNGLRGPVSAMHAVEDGLVVGGQFSQAGNAEANGIAKWTGSTWILLPRLPQPPGQSCDRGAVHAVWVHGGEILCGGTSSQSGGGAKAVHMVSRWDGGAWVCLGEPAEVLGFGEDPTVYVLAEYEGDLVIGGHFTRIGGRTMNGVARWSGKRWEPLAGGLPDTKWGGMLVPSFVNSLISFDGRLVAAGDFLGPDGERAGVAAFNGREWAPLGGGTNGSVRSLAVWNGKLVAGGSFTMAGDLQARNVAAWNGTAWESLGEGLPSAPSALCVYQGNVIAAMAPRPTKDPYEAGLFIWDGRDWAPFGDGEKFDGEVRALAVCGGDLYVGGRFGMVGEIPSVGLARWIPDAPRRE